MRLPSHFVLSMLLSSPRCSNGSLCAFLSPPSIPSSSLSAVEFRAVCSCTMLRVGVTQLCLPPQYVAPAPCLANHFPTAEGHTLPLGPGSIASNGQWPGQANPRLAFRAAAARAIASWANALKVIRGESGNPALLLTPPQEAPTGVSGRFSA
jgi:hypothetical protein